MQRSLAEWTTSERLGLTQKFARKKLCQMIVFECIGMPWHAGMACWHAIPSTLACLYPQLQDKENMVWHFASNAKTAGKSDKKMEDRRSLSLRVDVSKSKSRCVEKTLNLPLPSLPLLPVCRDFPYAKLAP